MTPAGADPTAGAEAIMQLIFNLRRNGVTDPAVLTAFENTPREVFVEQALQAGARGYIGKSSAPVVLAICMPLS